jgi:hypothetical protein
LDQPKKDEKNRKRRITEGHTYFIVLQNPEGLTLKWANILQVKSLHTAYREKYQGKVEREVDITAGATVKQ